MAGAGNILGSVRNILVTNDDGIEADGLRALHRALRQIDEARVVVIAPDGPSQTIRPPQTRP